MLQVSYQPHDDFISIDGQSYSSACSASTRSMKVKSILIPPNGAEKFASRLDPPEYGTVIAQLWSKNAQDIRTHWDLVFVAYLRKL